MKKVGKIKILTISALATFALAGSIALAQTTVTEPNAKLQNRGEGRGEGKRWGGHGRGQGGMFRGVALTEDQKTRMTQIHESFGARTQLLREQLKAKRQELRQASEGDTFNEGLATQKLQEIASLEAKLMGERFKSRQEMLSTLTPEQKTQLEQRRAESRAKRGERLER